MGAPKFEVAKHAAAFELWYALGADRSLSEAGRRLGVAANTVHVWSKAFKWEERLRAREKLVADLVAEKSIQDEAQSRADMLKITRGAILRFAASLQDRRDADGKIILPATAEISAQDFVALGKFDQMLRGKPTERSELMIGGPAFDKLIDAIAAVVEREVTDADLRQRLALGFQEAAATMGTA